MENGCALCLLAGDGAPPAPYGVITADQVLVSVCFEHAQSIEQQLRAGYAVVWLGVFGLQAVESIVGVEEVA